MSKYQLNPLLSEGLTKLYPKKARDGIAYWLKKVRKGNMAADPIAAASLFSPVPGGAVIGNSYVKAIDPNTRARAYHYVLNRPDKAITKGIVGVPKATLKTFANIPKSVADAYDTGSEIVTKQATRFGVNPLTVANLIPLR